MVKSPTEMKQSRPGSLRIQEEGSVAPLPAGASFRHRRRGRRGPESVPHLVIRRQQHPARQGGEPGGQPVKPGRRTLFHRRQDGAETLSPAGDRETTAILDAEDTTL